MRQYIVNIPINKEHVGDVPLWYFSKDENYTIKSGYMRALLLKKEEVWGERLRHNVV